jgi:multicomponent K+:H+ antiporter subunit G
VHELLITLFLFITAPVSANLMAKAALHLPRRGPVRQRQYLVSGLRDSRGQ